MTHIQLLDACALGYPNRKYFLHTRKKCNLCNKCVPLPVFPNKQSIVQNSGGVIKEKQCCTSHIPGASLRSYIQSDHDVDRFNKFDDCKCVEHITEINAVIDMKDNVFCLQVPLNIIVDLLSVSKLCVIAKAHKIVLPTRCDAAFVRSVVGQHCCYSACAVYPTIFSSQNLLLKEQLKNTNKWTVSPDYFKDYDQLRYCKSKELEPGIPSIDYTKHSEEVCRNYCEKLDPKYFQESGCAICGLLSLTSSMVPLAKCNDMFIGRKTEYLKYQPIQSSGRLKSGPLESCVSKDNDILNVQSYLESCVSKDNDKSVFASDSWLLATAYVSY